MSHYLTDFVDEVENDIRIFVNRSSNYFTDKIIKDKNDNKFFYVNKYAVVKEITDSAYNAFPDISNNNNIDDQTFGNIDLESKSEGDTFYVDINNHRQQFIMGTLIISDTHIANKVDTYFHISRTGEDTNKKMSDISLPYTCVSDHYINNLTTAPQNIEFVEHNDISPEECKQKLIDSDYTHSFTQKVGDLSTNINCYLTKDEDPVAELSQQCTNDDDQGYPTGNSYRMETNNSNGKINNFNKLAYMDYDSNFHIIEDNKVGNSNDFITVQERRFDTGKLTICSANNCRINCKNNDDCDGLVYKDEHNTRTYYEVDNSNNIFSDLSARIYDPSFGILMKGKKLITEGFGSHTETSTLNVENLLASNGVANTENPKIRYAFENDNLLAPLQAHILSHTANNVFLVKTIKDKRSNKYNTTTATYEETESEQQDNNLEYSEYDDPSKASSTLNENEEPLPPPPLKNNLNFHYETTYNTLWVGLFIFSLILIFKIIR